MCRRFVKDSTKISEHSPVEERAARTTYVPTIISRQRRGWGGERQEDPKFVALEKRARFHYKLKYRNVDDPKYRKISSTITFRVERRRPFHPHRSIDV